MNIGSGGRRLRTKRRQATRLDDGLRGKQHETLSFRRGMISDPNTPIGIAQRLARKRIQPCGRSGGALIRPKHRNLISNKNHNCSASTGTNRAKEVKLDQYEKITGKRFDPARVPLDEISRLAVRGEISTLQLMAARRYRLICRARDAQLLRKLSSLLNINDVDLCHRLLLRDQSLNEIARNLHYVRCSLLHRLWTCLDTLTREFFPQQVS